MHENFSQNEHHKVQILPKEFIKTDFAEEQIWLDSITYKNQIKLCIYDLTLQISCVWANI